MKYPFENLKDNKSFWTFFFITSFPLAYDETLDLDLISFIDENYEDISKSIFKWSDEFTQYY